MAKNAQKKPQGFGSMDAVKLAEVSRKGGLRAHKLGKAHEWDAEEAREAGRRGGIASQLSKLEKTRSLRDRVLDKLLDQIERS